MNENHYCKIYDENLNLVMVCKDYREYNDFYRKVLPIEVINYGSSLSMNKKWYLYKNYKATILDDWFREMGWNSKDGFDSDEKKTLFRLKFV